ncbi:MAG: SIS domain-containing protein [Eubacteriales bacterium]|nr:SIS domain-containing protein [Eubacteriales bacterium]
MNNLLTNIYEQPAELKKVLDSLLNEYHDVVKTIAGKMNSAGRIILTSMGSAYYSLFPTYYYLKKAGYHVWLEQTSELLDEISLLNENDVCILMSRSGESYEVAKLPSILKARGIETISITMTPDSTMAKYSDYVLIDNSTYDDLVCTKAYTSMALCGLFCAQTAWRGRVDDRTVNELFRMLDWMEANKEIVLGRLQQQSCLAEADGFYCLSRGYGIGVIESASLWIEEEAKKCCHPSTIDNFYHGPIEVIQNKVMNIFLNTEGNDRSCKIWKLICDNTDLSLYVGPEGQEGCGNIVLYYPEFDFDKEYYMILLALFFQLIAYQCTLGAERVPGEFQILNDWVVT